MAARHAPAPGDGQPANPVERARSISSAIFERQYEAGMRTIQSSDWANDIYTLILNECPHLPEEAVVRLFRNRHPSEAETVLGQALFQEYNLAHGASLEVSSMRRPSRARTRSR